MIGRPRPGDGGPAPSAESPWASDAIRVEPEPAGFEWPSVSERAPTDDDLDPERPGHRGRAVGVAIGAAALLAVGAIVLWPRADDAPTPDADAPDAPPTTLATLPGADPQVPSTLEAPATTATPIDAVVEPVEVPEIDDVLDPPPDASSETVTIDVPPAVAAIAGPSEIVLLDGGQLVTIELPSGTLRRTVIDGIFGGNQMVVAPTATAITGDRELVIVARSGDVTTLPFDDLDALRGGVTVYDWVRSADGSSAFVVESFSIDGPSTTLLVNENGDIQPFEIPTGAGFFYPLSTVNVDGSIVVDDAGGSYLLGADGGATRLTTDRVLAGTADHLLVRRCSDALACTAIVVDRATGVERLLDDANVDLSDALLLDLAPDASGVSATDSSGRRQLVDFDTGVVTETNTVGFGFAERGWAADGSGVFAPGEFGRGVSFYDRAAGEWVDFARDLDAVSTLAVFETSGDRIGSSRLASGPIQLSDPITTASSLDLLVVGTRGRAAVIDLDELTAHTWAIPELTGAEQVELLAFDDGVAALGVEEEFAFTLRPGSATPWVEPQLAPPSPRLPGPEPGLVWARDPVADATAGVAHRLVVADGSLPASDGAEILVERSELLGSDSRGGLVAATGGGVFALDGTTTEQLTTGELLALGRDNVLVRECDEALECEVISRNRGSGLSFSPSDPLLGRAVGVDGARPGPLADTVSPDGAALVVDLPPTGDPGDWAIVDLRIGSQTSIPVPDPLQPLVWNSTADYMAFVSDGELFVYDRNHARVAAVAGISGIIGLAAVDKTFVEV